ncbi:hypothetical protein NDU88_000361 [Pleurodeles waltl]|uniref:Uncharacterized protein n=1 Tax=Pleurodeles waltl TaxID=8319 RepID=A0AAV7UPR8_PLEWA|nr:hypothetical protein NDU88_000361 [Pleurodeles waltl]
MPGSVWNNAKCSQTEAFLKVPDSSGQAVVQCSATAVTGPALLAMPVGLTPAMGNLGKTAVQAKATAVTEPTEAGSIE